MTSQESSSLSIEVDYFDGKSSRRHPVRLSLREQHVLVEGDGVHLKVPLGQVRWPERTRHGVRISYFEGHGSVQCADSVAWDQWLAACGVRESGVIRLQQSWRWALVSAAATLMLLTLAYLYVLPAIAQGVLLATPPSADAPVGKAALQSLDNAGSTKPSTLTEEQQRRIESQMLSALSSSRTDLPAWKLVFRKSDMGANAVALPGGTVMMTDRLVELSKRDPQFLSAVLAHELGHLQHRHGMSLLIRVSVLGVAASAIWGDFSGTLASVPVLLGAAGYSRDAEREADAFAVEVLTGLHRSPMEMVDVLQALADDHKKEATATGQGKLLAIAFASHPLDDERKEFFRNRSGAKH
jgi:Zn-dependent protease with chaperone function